jgi:hypothetical protein
VFEKFPELDLVKFDVEVFAGAARVPLIAQHELLGQFAASLVLRLMCHALVHPSALRFYLPYPGRKPQVEEVLFFVCSEPSCCFRRRFKSI